MWQGWGVASQLLITEKPAGDGEVVLPITPRGRRPICQVQVAVVSRGASVAFLGDNVKRA